MKKLLHIICMVLLPIIIVSNEKKPSPREIIQDVFNLPPAEILQQNLDDAFRTSVPTVSPINPEEALILTKPIIIDDNNPEFKNKNVIEFPANIIYAPAKNYQYPYIYAGYEGAIIVNKDNVTINFRGKTLKLADASAPNFNTNIQIAGIAIMPGVKNCKIISATIEQPPLPGAITGFTGYAIYAYGGSQAGLSTSYDVYQYFIKNLTIRNILIYQNTGGGIFAGYTIGTKINFVDIFYNFAKNTNYGICFSQSNAGSISNTNINYNSSYTNFYGILLNDTVGMIVDSCSCNFNASTRNGSIYAYAIIQDNTGGTTRSLANIITNCDAIANISSNTAGQESVSYYINGPSSRNLIQNNRSIIGGEIGLLAQGTGIKLTGGVFNCNIQHNLLGYHITYGILDTATKSTSFYTNNVCFFNGTNYNVNVSDGHGGSQPLQVLAFDQNTLSNYTYQTPFYENLSIIAIN